MEERVHHAIARLRVVLTLSVALLATGCATPRTASAPAPAPAQRSALSAADDALLVPENRARFTVRLPTDVPIEVGRPTPLAVNPDRLYFFDPDSGLSLRHPTDQAGDQD